MQYCLFQSNTLHSNTVTPCNIPHRTATHIQPGFRCSSTARFRATHCNSYLRFTAIHCNTHPIAAAHCNTLQQPAVAQVLKLQCSGQDWSFASCFATHAAACCNILQHTATHYNSSSSVTTGRQTCIGCLKVQDSFRKRACQTRALLRKMTHQYKAFYASSSPCTRRRHLVTTLQHAAAYCNILLHTAAYCKTL